MSYAERGHNQAPDVVQQTIDRLAKDYASVTAAVEELEAKANAMAAQEITDRTGLESFSNFVVALRDKFRDVEATRVAEKEPLLRGGQAVDGFFKAKLDQLERAGKALTRVIDTYNQKRLAEERRIREEQRREAERIAEETRKREAAERQAAEEAEAAARRMRKPENIETQEKLAQQHTAEADDAAIEHQIAAQNAEDARISTQVKAADMVRERFDEGRVVTMKQEGYAEIVDKDQLDKDLLWPFIKDEAVAVALRQWAKTTGHKKQMAGASIGFRDKTVIR